MYFFQRTTCRCPLCRHNWECITQPHIKPLSSSSCYCWMLLLFLFICGCSSTTQAEQEKQQHYKVTTILTWTKRFHNLCTLIHLLLFSNKFNFLLEQSISKEKSWALGRTQTCTPHSPGETTCTLCSLLALSLIQELYCVFRSTTLDTCACALLCNLVFRRQMCMHIVFSKMLMHMQPWWSTIIV